MKKKGRGYSLHTDNRGRKSTKCFLGRFFKERHCANISPKSWRCIGCCVCQVLYGHSGRWSWHINIIGPKPNLLSKISCLPSLFLILPQHAWALVSLSCFVFKAVEKHLHRKSLCISNSWDTELTSSLTDLHGDACCADMQECMSPLPPSALWRHILSSHWWLWQESLFCLCATMCIVCVHEIEDVCECQMLFHSLPLSHTNTKTHTHTHTCTPGQSSSWQGVVWLLIRVFITPAGCHDSTLWSAAPTIVPQIWTYHLITLGEERECLVKMQVS